MKEAMEEGFEQEIYSKNVIEFVTVASEYCGFLEQTANFSRPEFVEKLVRLVPLLYLKATLLPSLESIFDEETEKFVSESDYDFIHNTILTKLGKFNDYLEVFDRDIQLSEGPLSASLAENLTDVYQDLKDFLTNFQVGTPEVMNDALVELNKNFQGFWGQRIVNSLRALHSVYYGDEELEEEEEPIEGTEETQGSSNWMFEQAKNSFSQSNQDEMNLSE